MILLIDWKNFDQVKHLKLSKTHIELQIQIYQ